MLNVRCLVAFMVLLKPPFCYDSPPPHRIIRRYPSPGYSPRAMPPKKMPCIPWKDYVGFFRDAIDEATWDAGERAGVLFSYAFDAQHPHARDASALKSYASICLAHLKRFPHGLVTKKQVEKALDWLSTDKRRNVASKTPLDFQAYNYCRLFSDIRNIKNSATTGARLASHTKVLVDAMKIVDPG